MEKNLFSCDLLKAGFCQGKKKKQNVLVLYLALMYNFCIMSAIFERSSEIRLQCNLLETRGAHKVGE